jgi:hypothetical protein
VNEWIVLHSHAIHLRTGFKEHVNILAEVLNWGMWIPSTDKLLRDIFAGERGNGTKDDAGAKKAKDNGPR